MIFLGKKVAAAGGSPTWTSSTSGPYFTDTANTGSGVNQLTYYHKGTLTAPASAMSLFSISALYVRLELLADGTVRLSNIKDNAGTNWVTANSSSSGVYGFGAEHELILSVSLTSGYASVYLDGSLLGISATWTPGGSDFPTNRQFQLGHYNTTGIPAGTHTTYKLWKTVTGDATLPGTAPHHAVSGPAATTNADSWKLGSDAT